MSRQSPFDRRRPGQLLRGANRYPPTTVHAYLAMQNPAQLSSPRKVSSNSAAPHSSPPAKPLPSEGPIVSFAIKGAATKSATSQPPPRPPTAVFSEQVTSPVRKSAAAPSLKLSPSQSLPFPRSSEPKDALPTNSISVCGASSLAKPAVGVKAVKMELEEGEEGEVSEDPIDVAVPLPGNIKESAFSECTCIPVFQVAADSNTPLGPPVVPRSPPSASQSNGSSSTRRREDRRPRYSASPERKPKQDRASPSNSQEKRGSAPVSQQSKGATQVKWEGETDAADGNRKSHEGKREASRPRSQSRGATGRDDAVRPRSRGFHGASSSSRPRDSTDHPRRTESWAADDMDSRQRDPSGHTFNNISARPDSWEAPNHMPNFRDRSREQQPSRHGRGRESDNRYYEQHRSQPTSSQSSYNRSGLDYGPSDRSTSHNKSEDRQHEERNGWDPHQSGIRTHRYGPNAHGYRRNGDGQSSDAYRDGSDPRSRADPSCRNHHDRGYDSLREHGRMRLPPSIAQVTSRPTEAETSWDAANQQSTTGFTRLPGWQELPGPSSRQNDGSLQMDQKPSYVAKPPSQNGQISDPRDNGGLHSRWRISQPSNIQANMEPPRGQGGYQGQRAQPWSGNSLSNNQKGPPTDPAKDRPLPPKRESLSPKQEFTGIPGTEQTASRKRSGSPSLKRPGSTIHKPRERSPDEPLNKRPRIEMVPPKAERTERFQQDVQMADSTSMPSVARPGPPEDDIPPAPPSPPPAPPPEPSGSDAMAIEPLASPMVSTGNALNESTDTKDVSMLSTTAPVKREVSGESIAMAEDAIAAAQIPDRQLGDNPIGTQNAESLVVPGAPVPMGVLNSITPVYSPVLPPPAASVPSSPVIPASQAGTVWHQTSPMQQSSPVMEAGVTQCSGDPSRPPTRNRNSTYSLHELRTPAVHSELTASVPDKEFFIRRKGDKLDSADDLRVYHKIFMGTSRLDDYIMPTGADKKDATLGKGTFGSAFLLCKKSQTD